MKRLCAILLGLMMLAGLCACGRRTSPAPAPKTPEPVTVITPAQPAPSEAVPVSTPDGTTPLTAAELDWFGRCFFNVVPGWGPNRFLTCAYARPEDMDLAAVLACGPEGGWNVTSQERNMIAAGGTDSVVRIPLEQAQELMLRYTGLALSDTQGVGLDSLRYLSEYNAYYRVGGEAEAAYCRILSGWHTADGLTVLQYDGGTVTLRQLDGRWVFVSRRKQPDGFPSGCFRYFCYSPAPFIFSAPRPRSKTGYPPSARSGSFLDFFVGISCAGGRNMVY